ncbi:MAG: cation:proton antiporter [Rickettsiaceae bacterium]|jgi:multicomponent Na+:H+ antiporter subunit D|nr:cation:proton antiporter [Rickettsiaceae bacterium]
MSSPAPLNFLIISTMLLGMINLVAPFFTKEDSKIRSFFLLSISIFFLFNVIIIDDLFINGTVIKFTLLDIGKYSIAFSIEPLGLIFLTMLAVLWVPALLYTIKFLTFNHITNSSKYLFFVNCCILLGCLIALSANLITMFIVYELLTLCTIPLIVHHFDKRTLAGLNKYIKILLLSSITLFLPAVIVVYSKIGTGTFVSGGFIKHYFSDSAAIFLLLSFIFGISKAALYPLHGWLPAAMVASYPVSALLHAVVVVKTGLFCIYKVLFYVFGLEYLQYLFGGYNWLVIIPAITILYSSLQALKCNEIKMILAYSTINQLSIALISAFLFTPKGLAAAVIHMVSHSFSKICLFYSAGNFYSSGRTYYLTDLTGINKNMPKTSAIFLVSTLSLIGIPPFAGFISKFYVMVAAAKQQNLLVMLVIAISSLFSAFYMLKILGFIYEPVKTKNVNNKEKKLPLFMFISLVLCIISVTCFFFIQQTINIFLNFM